ncbi:Riboflavin biosynthesis protein [Chlamydiales bacterium SCGC AB-751-O23]|jgi:riboflavin kinase / FMN adenylyltransferase|nr:Riboflavin biosynthesis protein [Chlamydiales bacterium SCGC AB-751-O23]
MQIVENLNDLKNATLPWAFTIGNFDGLHLGHQYLIKELLKASQEKGLQSGLYTFKNHPQKVLQEKKRIKTLMTPEMKLEALSQWPLSAIVTKEFSNELAVKSYKDFLTYFCQKVNLKLLIFGPDTAIGSKRSGSYEKVKAFGKELDFEVVKLPFYTQDNHSYSSTEIKKLLESAQLEKVKNCLGRDYSIKVKREKQESSDAYSVLLNLPSFLSLPSLGVYTVKAKAEEKEFNGTASISPNGKLLALNLDLQKTQLLPKGEWWEVSFLKLIKKEK